MIKQRGQAVTDKILDTAEQLFYTQGYNNTGINQVIEEAGIAKNSLYKHFESKGDLMVAYVQRLHQRWYGNLQAAVDSVADPKEKLLAVLDYPGERQLVRAYGGCPFVKANSDAGMSDPRVLAEIQQVKEQLKGLISQLVASVDHKKILTDEELTETIFLMTEGGIVLASVFKQDRDLKAAKEIIRKLI